MTSLVSTTPTAPTTPAPRPVQPEPDRVNPDPDRPVSEPLYPCGCGKDGCEWSLADMAGVVRADEDGMVPHAEVVRATQWLLQLEEVCRFFHDHLERSILLFSPVAAEYPAPIAHKAVLEATNTWHGCPEEALGRC